MSTTLAELTDRLIAFRDARDWRRFHSLKNLIMSVSIESAELLELTQWAEDDALEARVAEPEFRARLAEECADVLLYLLLVAEREGARQRPQIHRVIRKSRQASRCLPAPSRNLRRLESRGRRAIPVTRRCDRPAPSPSSICCFRRRTGTA
jgi:NTP pyrophosphatase (non-canonical NTP hydrolase)